MINLKSDIHWLNQLAPRIESFLAQDVLEVSIDGQNIRGYRSPDARSIWIRDYSDMLRGVRYYESDVRSTVQHFADTQAMNGRIFDYFTTWPEKLPCERENWTKYVRVPVEADVEYRFVKAAWLAWQANGDTEWIRKLLPHLERALNYSMTDPQRWDDDLQLVKRPYTIDTWDFAYSEGLHDWLHFQIDENTIWGIFHGDNTGLYEALICLANICESLGKKDKQEHYSLKAGGIKKRINQLSWNGRYYKHFHKISQITIPELDEDQQLSLSNPMAVNRGVADLAQAVALLREYQARADKTNAFAPWFSIDPPFPSGIFGDEKLVGGAYINGGIFPLAGGELALTALENGFEKFGIEQLRKYESLSSNGETYLWYFPDGEPSSLETSTSPDATPTDGWGSSAFLFALIQGVCGITDLKHSFNNIKFSPRWPAVGSKSAKLEISYAASGENLSYSFKQSKTTMSYKL
ncbi:MAG: hypothetical protein J7L96_10550, partial [Bacteroidales bacterium]|nr:hypothetical protein [Bacteroidales bacterium]